MEPIVDTGFVTVVVQLVFLECILSLDNAAVMGAMVAHLPRDKPPPWPERLRRVMRWSDRLLGPQREAALKVGLFGAYAGRIVMLALASLIIQLEWVQILGATYLLYLAVDHFADHYVQEQQAALNPAEQARLRHAGQGFWQVVLALNLADMAFSLDNVVAAVALSDRLWVVVLGVGIGIIVIRFAATIFTRLIEWEPALEHAAYLLLLAIGGELLLEKVFDIGIDHMTQFAISVAILVLTIAFARIQALKPLLVIFRPWELLFAAIQFGINALVSLLTLVVRGE